MTIGENIRKLRRDAGLSQEELAEVAQVTNKAVSSWEIGGRTPRLGALRRIAEHFDVPVSELLHTDGPESAPTPPKVEPEPPPLVHRAEPGAAWMKTTSLRESAAPWLSPSAAQQLAAAYAAADEVTRALVCRALGIEALPVHRPAMAMDWLGESAPARELIVYESVAAAWAPLSAQSRSERLRFAAEEVPAGTDFGVRVDGEGLPPALRPGDIAFVRTGERIGAGEVGIFAANGGAVYRQCARGAGGVRALGIVLGVAPRRANQ